MSRPTMIRWKLREVMQEYRIRASELGDELGITPAAVSNLRKSDMPRIGGDRLNDILVALNKLRQRGTAAVGVTDLIEYTLTHEEATTIANGGEL